MTIKGKKITFSLFNLGKSTPEPFVKIQTAVIGLCASLGVISYSGKQIDLMALSGLLGTILPLFFNLFSIEEEICE